MRVGCFALAKVIELEFCSNEVLIPISLLFVTFFAELQFLGVGILDMYIFGGFRQHHVVDFGEVVIFVVHFLLVEVSEGFHLGLLLQVFLVVDLKTAVQQILFRETSGMDECAASSAVCYCQSALLGLACFCFSFLLGDFAFALVAMMRLFVFEF